MARDPSLRILEGKLALEIARFGLPLALGMVLQNLFNLADAYLVAQLPPAEAGPAIGALGICDPLAAIGTIISYGVSTGTGAILSQQKGAKDELGVQRTIWQSFVVVGLLSVVFGILGVSLSGFVLRDVIGAKGAVAHVATRYLQVIIGGSCTIFFLLQLTSIQRALGSAKTPASLLVLGNALNILFAVVLIFGETGPYPHLLTWAQPLARALHAPRMGILGAAWATILARALVLVPNVIVLMKRFNLRLPPRGERWLDGKDIARILRIAWPSSAQFVLRIGAMLFLNSLVARTFTSEADQTATTAMGVVFRVDTTALFMAMGWGSAAQTFVGQNLGADCHERARASGWITALFDALTTLVLITVLYFFGEQILRVFASDDRTVHIGLLYLSILLPAYLPLGVAVVLGNAMAGSGATKQTLKLDALVLLCFQLPISLLVLRIGQPSLQRLFTVTAVTHAFGLLVYVLAFLRGRWLNAEVISSRTTTR